MVTGIPTTTRKIENDKECKLKTMFYLFVFCSIMVKIYNIIIPKLFQRILNAEPDGII